MAWDGIRPIELLLGREGLILRRNADLIPLGALRNARNLTLEDSTLRTAGGASKLGTPPAAVTIMAAVDYFPTLGTQRTVVYASGGTIRKDDGAGGSWATLKSGLTTADVVPMFALAGAELVNRNKKLFVADRVNTVQVLSADGSTTSDLATPPADWNGTNQPGWLAPHGRWLWGGGNANDPKRAYRSSGDDHEDWTTLPFTLSIAGEYERLVAGMDYKGGLLLWGYPEGVWFVRADSPDAPATAWQIDKVARPGAAGPANIIAIEDDVLWTSPDGSQHLVSATNATGSARASDIGARKLGSFFADSINLSLLSSAQWVYYAHKQVAMLACHAAGQTTKNLRVDFDVRQTQEVGERWLLSDRDRNEALFMRKKSEVLIPAMGDAVGQIWELDQAGRNKDGTGYESTWETADVDFGRLLGRAGRKTSGKFIQLIYDPRQSATLTLEVQRDGDTKQTIQFSLDAQSGAFPYTLPFTLGGTRALRVTRPKRLLGQAYRWAFKGTTSGINADASVAGLMIGAELAA